MGRTRVAVVQIAYHPAILAGSRSPLEDPLFKAGAPDSLTAAGKELPEVLVPRLEALRRRIRETYNAQLLARVRAILAACRGWQVEVVVFPEYSIPWEILGDVASAAGEMVVVAGTHTFDQRAKKSGVYERLGSLALPKFGQSVCPILHRGRLLAHQAKLNPAVPERASMRLGDAWAPVDMPEALPGPMGVMVCLDFLFRDGEQHQKLVAEGLARCRFLAVPSLTPWYTLPEFEGKAWEEARRYGRPVLYCDSAEGGGTAIYVDEGRPVDLKSFPEHAGLLDPGDEGVIVADVDLGYVRPGESTRYDQPPPVVAVAAATLVYRANPTAEGYVRWLEESGPLLAREDDAAVEALAERVAAARDVLLEAAALSGGAARGRRLRKLVREIEGVVSVEQIRQLTRDVVVPAGVLPMAAVQVGLARGAADEIHRWVIEQHGAGGYGTVVDALRDRCSEIERKAGPWDEGARRAVEGVSAAVRGGAKPADMKALVAFTDVLEEAVEHGFEEAQAKASELFMEGRYEQARTEYGRMLELAIPMAKHAEAAERPGLCRWVAQCRLNVALVTLNLQEQEEAREVLGAVDPAYLPIHGKIMLAETLAMIGERARAEAILPDESELSDEDRPRLRNARQLFEILAGRVPEDLDDSPDLQLRAAAALLDQHDLAAAALQAVRAMQGSHGHRLITAFACQVLVEALRRTVHEVPPFAKLVPIDLRPMLIDLVEDYFGEPEARDGLPPRVAEHLRKAESIFRSITGDPDAPDEESADTSSGPDPDDHPWHGRWRHVVALAKSKEHERALTEALALAGEFPERAPIEVLIAQIYANLSRPVDALAHARVAYEQFPAMGYRLFFARLHLNNQQPEDAWQLVKDLDDDKPTILWLRMGAAKLTGRFAEAEESGRRYLEHRPGELGVQVGYAQLLWYAGRSEDAATFAWKVYEEHRGKLDAELLFVCASLQGMTGSLAAPEVRRRILDILLRAEPAFAKSSDGGERRRYLLRLAGDEPGPAVAPSDGEQRQSLVNGATRLAHLGAMPVLMALERMNASLALVVTILMDGSRGAHGHLCPPISPSDVRPTLDLRNAKILVTELELVLLEALGLTAALRASLGPDGRLVLPQSSLNRIYRDKSELQIDANRENLERAEALLREVERLPEVPPGVEVTVVVDEPTVDGAPLTWRALVGHLRASGSIDGTKYAALNDELPGQGAPPALLTTLPDHIVVQRHQVSRLSRWDAVRPAFDAFPGRLFLDATTKSYFRRARDELLAKKRADELATRIVHGRMMEGWIQLEHDEPTVTDLPPLRNPDQLFGLEFIVEPLQEMVRSRRLMLEHPSWWRLSAEFYGSASLGAPELTAQLAWPSDAVYRSFVLPLRETAARDLTLPALIRMLDLEPKDAEARLLKLADLGFADALGAEEILGLVRRYGGLDGAEPRRILDAQEWMARTPGHHGGDLARRRLAYAYAAAMFNAFLANDLSEDQRNALLGTLLHRQEIIAEKSVDNMLDQTFATLAFATVEQWQRAWKPHESGGGVLDLEGSIASLWRALSIWSGLEGPRRAARGRAIREIWRLLSGRPGGPSAAVTSTLDLAQWTNVAEDKEEAIWSPAPELDALLILSALWREDPFKDGPFAEVLRDGVASLGSEIELLGGRYPMILSEDAEPVPVPAPVEALLLRASDVAVRQDAARRLKAEQGPYDGICYKLLEAIEQSPDQEHLQRYAEHASTAFFRLVQDEPPFLRIWGQAQRLGAPDERHRLEELLEILSEEPRGRLGDEPLVTILVERMDGGGCWSKREDSAKLFALASEVPGTLSGYAIHAWLDPDGYEGYVESSLHEIDHAEDLPIARVVRAVLFLRVAASHRPLVRLPEGEVDLREILPARLERLLTNVSEPPKKADTFGAAEGALLRVCGEVIQRLAHPAILPFRVALWLTWRLFQWFCLQLDATPPDARRDGIRRLVAQAPPPGVPRDILDPLGFGRNHFDHRLAAVLHALGTMDDLAKLFREEQPAGPTPEPRRASSPALEDKLLKLAHGEHLGPSVGSVLDWNAPGNVPDLALNALLCLSSSRFAELSPEARSRRFSELPDDPDALQKSDPWALAFANRIVLAAADAAARLTGDERVLLEAKVRAMTSSPRSRVWRWVIFLSLFRAGADHLEDEARSLTIEHIKEGRAAINFGHLLLGVASRDPARVEQTVDAILAAAAQHDAAIPPDTATPPLTVGLAVGALGRLLVHGKPEGQHVARALLLRLAERPPFRDDSRMSEVIGFFGLREPPA